MPPFFKIIAKMPHPRKLLQKCPLFIRSLPNTRGLYNCDCLPLEETNRSSLWKVKTRTGWSIEGFCQVVCLVGEKITVAIWSTPLPETDMGSRPIMESLEFWSRTFAIKETVQNIPLFLTKMEAFYNVRSSNILWFVWIPMKSLWGFKPKERVFLVTTSSF